MKADSKLSKLSVVFDDINFLMDFSFLVDITAHLNELNIKLQGRCKIIFDFLSLIDGFKSLLNIFKVKISKNELEEFFPKCFELALAHNISDLNFSSYEKKIDDLISAFEKRFIDIEEVRPSCELFYNPLHCDILQQPDDFKIELCDLQADHSLKYAIDTGVDFWKNEATHKYPKIRNNLLRWYSVFTTSYSCEQAFSIMNLIKTKRRNSLSNVHLKEEIRVKLSETPIDWELCEMKND